VLSKDRSFWSWWQDLICIDCMSRFMGPGKSSSPVSTLSNCPSLLWGSLLEGEWGSPEWQPNQALLGAKTSSREQRPDFDLVGTPPMVVIRETLGATRTMCQLGSSPAGCISIRVTATLGYEWPLVRCYHLIVCLVYYWWLEDDDVMVILILMITIITLPLTLTWVNILLVYACSSL
jgi:hypothetical protein